MNVPTATHSPLDSTNRTDRAKETLESHAESIAVTDAAFPVRLRENSSATVHASIFRNPIGTGDTTLLAVPGLAETAVGFEKLAQALFVNPKTCRRVRTVVAVDLVGHGDSGHLEGSPKSVRFGDLTIDDNVSVILQAINALRAQGLTPNVILGRSMGGLAVQALQEHLLARGSSYVDLGIHLAILMAPVPPRGRPWSQDAIPDLSPFVRSSEELGSHLVLPPEVWALSTFSRPNGTVVSSAPTAEEVASRGYSAIEPAAVLAQLLETPDFRLMRPFVRAGAFNADRGCKLALVSFSEDPLVPVSCLEDLHAYLTDAPPDGLYLPITSDDAVHGMHLSNPAVVANAIASLLE